MQRLNPCRNYLNLTYKFVFSDVTKGTDSAGERQRSKNGWNIGCTTQIAS